MGIIWFLGGNGRGGGFNRCKKSLKGGLQRIHCQWGGAYLVLDTFTREQNMS